MWTDTGCERREWPPGVQHEMCVRGHSCEMTHETCVGTCPCGVHVPESRGRPPSGCGPQSRRLGAEPLKRAPTRQAQKCLHKVQLRQELWGYVPRPACARMPCVCGPQPGAEGEVAPHTYTHTDGLGSARLLALSTLGLGGRWQCQPGQAMEGRECGQGLKGQCEETGSARRGPVHTAPPGVVEGPHLASACPW